MKLQAEERHQHKKNLYLQALSITIQKLSHRWRLKHEEISLWKNFPCRFRIFRDKRHLAAFQQPYPTHVGGFRSNRGGRWFRPHLG